MKNVTISLDERVAAQVRVKAAVQGKSVSKFISDMLEREVGRGGKTQFETIEEFLEGALWPLSDENGRLPRREELYGERADELLRRYERSHSRDR
jgi:hypothetical protein